MVVGAEAAGAVTTNGKLGHVALRIVVAQAGEVGSKAGLYIRSAPTVAVAVSLKAVSVVDIWLVQILEELGRCSEILSAGSLGRLSEQGGDAVISESLGPGEDVLNLPYKAVACRCRCGGFSHLVAAAQVVLVGVAVVSPEGKIQTQGGAELEVFDNLKFPAETAHKLVGPALCSRKRERCNRVHHLIVASSRDGVHPSVLIVKHFGSTIGGYLRLSLFVGAGNIENRRKSHGGAQRRAPGGVGSHSRTGDICIGEIAAEGEFVEEITLFGLVHHLVGGVAAQGEAVVVGTSVVSSDYTVLTDVAK